MNEVLWKAQELPISDCAVCQECIKLEEECVIRLHCGHIFHYKCFVQFKSSKCALCRVAIDVPCVVSTPSSQISTEPERLPIPQFVIRPRARFSRSYRVIDDHHPVYRFLI